MFKFGDIKNINIVLKLFEVKKYLMGKKFDIFLFLYECNDLIGSKGFGFFKFKYILSNFVVEYIIGDFIELFYLEYFSYSSYYVDIIDWFFMLCDFDGVMIWLLLNFMIFVNFYSLFKECLEIIDSVCVWLSCLDEWELSYDVVFFGFLEGGGSFDIMFSVYSMEIG